MHTSTVDIAVIIVNYRIGDLAVKAAESVLTRDHGPWSVAVHLVDNASPDGEADRIRAALDAAPWGHKVQFHPEPTNHGFGRGNNVVLDALNANPPRFALLLNPDAMVEDGTIETLATFLDTTPQAAIAGASLRSPEGDPASAAFRLPSLGAIFSHAINFGPVSRLLKNSVQALPPETPRQPVGWVSGACVMLRFEASAAVDHFDPAFFLYYEEVDLMRRVGAEGWSVWYVPEARAIHIEGASTDVRSFRPKRQSRPAFLYEAWRLYFVKAYGPLGALGILAAQMIGMSLNFPMAKARGHVPSMPIGYFGHALREVVWPILRGAPRSNRF